MYLLPFPSVPAEQTPDLPFRTSPWCFPDTITTLGLVSLHSHFQNVEGRDCECSPSTGWGRSLFSSKRDYTILKGLQQMRHLCGWSRCEPGLRVDPGAATGWEIVCALKHPLPGYPAAGGPRCWGSRRNPIFWCHSAHRPRMHYQLCLHLLSYL